MSTVPKCTSWRGHKFEGRYDKGPVAGNYNVTGGSERHVEAMAERMRSISYVRDICVRCGHTIEPHVEITNSAEPPK